MSTFDFCKAFPSLEPRTDLQWLSMRRFPSTSAEVDLRTARLLCCLIRAAPVAVAPLAFHTDEGWSPSPWYGVVTHLLSAAQAVLASTWNSEQARQAVGVCYAVASECPCLAKMREDCPQLMARWDSAYLRLRAVALWTGTTDPSLRAMAAAVLEPFMTGSQRALFQARSARERGAYSLARRLFEQAGALGPEERAFVESAHLYPDVPVSSEPAAAGRALTDTALCLKGIDPYCLCTFATPSSYA